MTEKIKYNEEDLKDHHAVAAIIKNKKGDILMESHLKYGFWTIPIGKAKETQLDEEAIKEEVFEECNLTIAKLREIASKEYNYIRDGKNVKVVLHIFEALDYTGKLENKEPHKHREVKFLSLKEIKNVPYLSDSTLLYLETLGIKRKPRL